MTALTREQIFDGQPYFEAFIRPQATDIAVAKQQAETVEETAIGLSLTYIAMFGLMFALKYGMELFWGSVRNL